MEVKCGCCRKPCKNRYIHVVWESIFLDEHGNRVDDCLINGIDLCAGCGMLLQTILGPDYVPSQAIYLHSTRANVQGPVQGPVEEDGTPPAPPQPKCTRTHMVPVGESEDDK